MKTLDFWLNRLNRAFHAYRCYLYKINKGLHKVVISITIAGVLLPFLVDLKQTGHIYDETNHTGHLAAVGLAGLAVVMLCGEKITKVRPLANLITTTTAREAMAAVPVPGVSQARVELSGPQQNFVDVVDLWADGYSYAGHQTRPQRAKQWRDIKVKNSGTLRMISVNGEHVAYVCALPLSTRNHHHGVQKITDVTASDVCKPGVMPAVICLQSMWVKKEYRKNQDVVNLIVKAILEMCANFIPKNISDANFKRLIIYSERFTEEGDSLLQTLGFMLRENKTASRFHIAELRLDGLHPRECVNYDSYLETTSIIKELSAKRKA